MAGGFPSRLTTDSSEEFAPNWSRDGRYVYFYSNRTGRRELFKVLAEGGDAVQLTTNGGTEAFESPDSRFIYFAKGYGGGGPRGIWRMPVDGGEEVQVHDRGEVVLWAVLEQGLIYVNRESDPPAIELLDFETCEISQVAVIENPKQEGLSVSPDQRWILYTRGPTESDIILVENFR